MILTDYLRQGMPTTIKIDLKSDDAGDENADRRN